MNRHRQPHIAHGQIFERGARRQQPVGHGAAHLRYQERLNAGCGVVRQSGLECLQLRHCGGGVGEELLQRGIGSLETGQNRPQPAGHVIAIGETRPRQQHVIGVVGHALVNRLVVRVRVPWNGERQAQQRGGTSRPSARHDRISFLAMKTRNVATAAAGIGDGNDTTGTDNAIAIVHLSTDA
ncbi:MAG: hypothetical protein KIT73_02020 [Burkholderiales bacterium]|nr:hypothetical protein [Burkholderiales bacterium]